MAHLSRHGSLTVGPSFVEKKNGPPNYFRLMERKNWYRIMASSLTMQKFYLVIKNIQECFTRGKTSLGV